MKKLLAILLCLSLILALAACSKPESQTQQPVEQPAQTEDQPTEPTQAEQPSEPEALTYPIEQFTVGTTAVIETATFGEYNFDSVVTFRPEQYITRAETVTMINRMLGRNYETAAELHSMACPFPDVSQSSWAYGNIMEAAITHKH